MMVPHESTEPDQGARNEPSASFDPYHSWLAIPPDEQPPNHYRLLGIRLFESQRDVICNAADQRMVYLKTFAIGQHSELSQTLLNEVSAAKVCLLNEPKKRVYDDKLRKETAPSVATAPPPVQVHPVVVSQMQGDSALPQLVADVRPSVHSRKRPGSYAGRKWAICAAAISLLLIVGGPIVYHLASVRRKKHGLAVGAGRGGGGEV